MIQRLTIGFLSTLFSVSLLACSSSSGTHVAKNDGLRMNAPHRVTVVFESSPSDAEVYVDGKFRGTAPVTLALEPGEHPIEFRRAALKPWQRTLTVNALSPTRVKATMEKE